MKVKMRGFAKYTRLDRALKIVLSQVHVLNPELVPFNSSLGRVLAENVFSNVDVPPFNRSAVDGYAVKAANTFGASATTPANLRIVGSIRIGTPPKLSIKGGEAAEIMTGAMTPKGADAVIMVENTKATGERLKVFAPVTPGKNVSTCGEDVRVGELTLKSGQVLRPQDVGMLASTGNLKIHAVRRPRVGILATGDELREPGRRLNLAKTTNSNSYSIAAAVIRCGGVPELIGIAPDEFGPLQGLLKKAALYDMVIATGGSSVGKRDLVPSAIESLGKILFHGVAIRPGGPTAFGLIRGKPAFALAGFPVAALVAFDMLARPAILTMQGLPAEYDRVRLRAKLTRKVASTLGRADIVRVRLRRKEGCVLADPIAITGSSILSSMTSADGFIIVPEDVEGFDQGHEVEVELYR